MMNWFKTSNPVVERKKIDPGATFNLFENHWLQAVSVMENSEDSEGALTVISHLSQMISFLSMTRGESTPDKSCKTFWLHHRCSDRVIRWLHSLQIKGIDLHSEDEIKLIAMLHTLCEAASRDGELLGYLKNENEGGAESWDGVYSLASLLLEYSLRNDVELAETARYSFIMLIQLAPRYPGLEKSLSHETGLGLTNVVVSGLSAMFAQLPTFSEATPDQLNPFIEQVKFVNNVTEAASNDVGRKIAKCFSNSFLLAIMEPAMKQDGEDGSRSLHNQHDLSYVTSLNEEIGIVTHYFQIVCQHLTHPLLIRYLVHFINSKLLDILIYRLNHMNESICVAVSTLRLFNVLFELYCEDFWYAVILKYLLPQNHLMVSQRNATLPFIDFYDSSLRFLNLIPLCVIETLGSDTVMSHYVQYLNSESERWAKLDTVVSAVPCTNWITEEGSQQGTIKNFPYPMWKRSYDGTDTCDGKSEIVPRKLAHEDNSGTHQVDSSENSRNLSKELSSTNVNPDPLSQEVVESTFTTISLHPSPVLEEVDHKSVSFNSHPDASAHQKASPEVGRKVNSIPVLERLSVVTNQSDDYSSIDSSGSPVSEDSSSMIGSVGPFLDTVFVQLSNWPNLDLNVILMLTEVVSVLASSRIPLITSIFLDPNLTLQPCYTTFSTLLKRIRQDLEYHMEKVPKETLATVWELMNPKEPDTHRRTSNGSNSSGLFTLTSITSPSSSLGHHIGDTIRRRISGGGSGGAIANVLHLFNRKESPKVHPSSGAELLTPLGGSQGYRYLNRHAEPTDNSKLMAMKIILFSHWLLELSAIAHQLSWKPVYE